MIHNDLQLSSGRIKIEKLERLVCVLNNKKEYAVRIQIFKQVLNHRLVVQQCREQLKSEKKLG